MFYFIPALLFYTINGVFSTDNNYETFACEAVVTNMKNQVVELTDYCVDKPCLPKCCQENEILLNQKPDNTSDGFISCYNVTKLRSEDESFTLEVDFSDYVFYELNIDDILPDKKPNSSKITVKDFNWVLNKAPLVKSCGDIFPLKSYILNNGTMVGEFDSSLEDPKERWIPYNVRGYCLELLIFKNESGVYEHKYNYYTLAVVEPLSPQLIFMVSVNLISAFFFLLVLLVLSLLKDERRKLPVMLLMAYVAVMGVRNILETVNVFASEDLSEEVCNVLSPITYFLTISSFLWLNITSFDVWWFFRGYRKKIAINRQGELVKFLWYSLYVWGVAAAIAIQAVVIDNSESLTDVIKPGFPACFNDPTAVKVYLYIPMLIITVMNITLFFMTIYNIWLKKKENQMSVFNNQDSTISNQTKLRFKSFLKLSLVTGVSWAIEAIQLFFEIKPLAVHIILNLYNGLIGLIIFIIYDINKKSLLRMLFERFNIPSKYIGAPKSFSTSIRSKSTSLGSSLYSSKRRNTDTSVTNPSPQTALTNTK